MKKLLKYAKPYYAFIFIAAVASAGCSLAGVWVIDVLQKIIDKASQGTLISELPMLVINIVFAIIVGVISNYAVVAATGYFGTRVLKDLRRDALNAIMKTAPDFIENHNFGDVMERLSSDVEDLSGYMQNTFKDCLYVPIIVIVYSVYILSLNPLLALACIIPLAILVPVSIKLLQPIKVSQFKYTKLIGLTNNNIQEACDGADVIKAYNLQDKIEEKYYKDVKAALDISNDNDLKQYNIAPISELIRNLPTAITLCMGGYLAFNGSVTIGMMVAFMSAVKKINDPLEQAYQLVVRTQMAMISVKRVFYIMDMPPENNNEVYVLDKEIDKSGEDIFTFKNVSHTYNNSQKEAVSNINLTIKKGRKTAFIGKSGSGKSTLLKLIARQYELKEGSLCYYNKEYKELSPQLIRDDIALISQDAVLFPISVLDNIRIGKIDATKEEVERAAKLAKCDEFINNMPDKMDTVLDEKGSNLSGGQRQRIAIARAILKDAPILLLDEPTSALDKDTEKAICETIEEISEGKTVITVAHRLSTIEGYDVVVTMAEGNIVEVKTNERA